ncbi:MAG: rhomboid family intramembrane serine protease [Planctomycetota bacterium]
MSYDSPSFRLPVMTPAIKHLLIVNGIVFVLNMLLLGRLSAPSGEDGSGGYWLALSWSSLWDGFGLGLLRFLSYQFTHAFGDPMHLLLNMLVLYFFGTMAETRLGYRGVVKLYLIGGVIGALVHLGLSAIQGHADVNLVGASGSCYAFLVYAACMAPRSMVIFIIFPIQLWILAAGLVFLGLYATFTELAGGYTGGVAHGAHLGGAALGFVAHRANWFVDWAGHAGHERPSWIRGVVQGLQDKRDALRAQQAEKEQLQMDEILAKVKQEGLASLRPEERRFLEAMSKKSKRDE